MEKTTINVGFILLLVIIYLSLRDFWLQRQTA